MGAGLRELEEEEEEEEVGLRVLMAPWAIAWRERPGVCGFERECSFVKSECGGKVQWRV